MVNLDPVLGASGSSRLGNLARTWVERLRQSPFILGFLILSWPIFLFLVRSTGWIARDIQANIGFIPVQWEASNLMWAFVTTNVGIVIQHSWGQIIYVSLLLLTAGVLYESRHGTLRAMLIFYGASAVGVATLLFFLVTAPLNGGASWSVALAHTSWSGASVGAFGLLGAYLGSLDRPWPYLAAWGMYEGLVEWYLVPSMAVVMHVTGFLFGFVVSRLARVQTMPAPSATPEPVASES